jgi:hypothetical protein
MKLIPSLHATLAHGVSRNSELVQQKIAEDLEAHE